MADQLSFDFGAPVKPKRKRKQNPKKGRDYYDRNKEACRARCASYHRRNAERLRRRARERYRANKDRRYEKSLEWIRSHRERVNEASRRRTSRQDVRDKRAARARERRLDDLLYRLRLSIYKRLNAALRGKAKGGSLTRSLGCSIAEFRAYIESLWLPGMSWENRGVKGWHLDHIKPLSKFDLTDPEQFAEAVHFSNYQPLWAIDNIRKSNK